MIFKLIFLLSIPDDFLTMCQFLATWLPITYKDGSNLLLFAFDTVIIRLW